MTSLPTYNISGEPAEKVALPAGFLEKVSPRLLAQSVRVYLFNQRKAGAKTKTRSEVAKTTAKMYRQKGTGRARHGSYAAPIFVGGGISHGPSGKQNWTRKMPKAMIRKALIGALAEKAAENKVAVVEGAGKAKAKTSEARSLLLNIFGQADEKTLLVITPEQKGLKLALRNMENLTCLSVDRLNAYMVLSAKRLLLTAEAVEKLVKSRRTQK